MNTPDTRDALIKELVRVKPLVFNQRASGWWAMSPFGFYVVAPTKTDNGDQWGIWYPETDIEDDPDGYASNEGSAMAVSQHVYERRVLSAVEAVPASQIRAEALREAAEVAESHLDAWANDLAETRDEYREAQRTGKFQDRNLSASLAKTFAVEFNQRAEAVAESSSHTKAAILALIDAPKGNK